MGTFVLALVDKIGNFMLSFMDKLVVLVSHVTTGGRKLTAAVVSVLCLTLIALNGIRYLDKMSDWAIWGICGVTMGFFGWNIFEYFKKPGGKG